MMVTLASMTTSPNEAPPGLATVRAFVNTRGWDPDVEELPDPAALEAWLTTYGLAPAGEARTRGDLARAVRLREALRAVAAGNAGEPVPAEAIAALEEQRSRSRLAVTFGADGAPIVPEAGGIDRALGGLLAIVAHAMHDGTWPRLKACADDGCRWAFYDSSRSHRRTWCSMEVCGNRNKVRAYRRRQRADAEPAG